jgi:flagellar biosynthesis regulator FlaF
MKSAFTIESSFANRVYVLVAKDNEEREVFMHTIALLSHSKESIYMKIDGREKEKMNNKVFTRVVVHYRIGSKQLRI